jgi:lipoprotein-anchoring transpeptidase ErfK/SrfK
MRRIRRLRGAPALLLVAAIAAFLALDKTGHSGKVAQTGNSASTIPAAVAARGEQELAALTTSQEAFRAPGAGRLKRVAATRPITGERTVLPVLNATSHDRTEWLLVRLPGRPNGATGWIHQAGTKLEYTPWRIVVNTENRRVYAYDGRRLMRTFDGVFAAPATPTPKGEYFVEENVALSQSAVGYPYALALSARSDVFQEFEGGPGQIALHGLGNVGGTIGTAVSHGCIRLDTPDITWLAHHIDPGVPVTIS